MENNNILIEDDIQNISEQKRQKRWILTINNPVFADSGYTEVNPSGTDLEVVNDYYDLSVLKEVENKDFFEFRYIQQEKDGKEKIIKRPFFKNLDCIEKYFKSLKENGGLKYAIYQYEKSESGTYHIQGFAIYKESKRFKNVKQDFPTAHIIVPNGSNTQNRDYCTKKDSRIAEPVEIGEFSEMRSRNDIVEFLELVKLGASNVTLKTTFPVLYSQYGPEKIERFRQDDLKEEYGKKFRDVKVTYIYGEARTGKTTYIYENYPMDDICRVINYYKGTFEFYNFHKILVLDEFTGKIDITYMNNLLDKFPLDLPARFANRMACFEEVFIISNLPLTELYKEEQAAMPEVYKAFISRIQNIIRFTALGVWHFELKDGKPVQPPKQLKLSELKPIEGDGNLPF